jgi:hypothetical protein
VRTSSKISTPPGRARARAVPTARGRRARPPGATSDGRCSGVGAAQGSCSAASEEARAEGTARVLAADAHAPRRGTRRHAATVAARASMATVGARIVD